LNVLFEDKDLLLVHKPAGLSTESGRANHPSAETEAMEWLRTKTGSNRDIYLRAAHRLDRPTSGVLLFAKNKRSLSALMQQFELRETQKTYWAVVASTDLPEEASLTHWIGRSADRRSATVFEQSEPDAQLARLRYKVLKKQSSQSLLEIVLETGRFHQIRAQMAFIGCPIVGDEKYGAKAWKPEQIMLHAQSLSFVHPQSGETKVISCLPIGWEMF
jgi:23S rRNA pseudouridine1911/1915/1917 synthase